MEKVNSSFFTSESMIKKKNSSVVTLGINMEELNSSFFTSDSMRRKRNNSVVTLESFMKERPTQSNLKNKNILKCSDVVDRETTKKKLQRRLSLRPTVDSLQKRGIMKDFCEARIDNITAEEAASLFHRIQNRGGKLASELAQELRKLRVERSADEKAFDIKKLERSLQLRPSMKRVVEKNIMKMKGGESASRLFAAKALAGKLIRRPSMDSLVASGILGPREIISEEEEE